MKITILNGGHRSIELPLSDEELNFQMRQMGIRETIPKGKLVKVSEKDNPLQKLEGQFLNMDEVNFFARRMEHLTEYDRKVLAVYANDCDVSTIKDLINLTFSMKGLSLSVWQEPPAPEKPHLRDGFLPRYRMESEFLPLKTEVGSWHLSEKRKEK